MYIITSMSWIVTKAHISDSSFWQEYGHIVFVTLVSTRGEKTAMAWLNQFWKMCKISRQTKVLLNCKCRTIMLMLWFYISASGEYSQNQCSNSFSCRPCPDRLADCRSWPDGYNPFPGREWTADYVYCLKNRTLETHRCPAPQIFDPVAAACVPYVDPSTGLIFYIFSL